MSLLTLIQTACDELKLPRPSTVINSTDPNVRQLLKLAQLDCRWLRDSEEWTQLMRVYTFTTFAVSLVGDTVDGSATISNIPSTSQLQVGFGISGDNFQSNVTISAIVDSTTVTASQPATGTAAGQTLSYGQFQYALPSDFSRFINRTMWDRNYRWELEGPTSPQEWEWRKSGIVPSTPRRRFRIVGSGDYRFWIDPTPGATDTDQYLAFEYFSKNCILPQPWTPSTAVTTGAIRSSNGYIYTATTTGTTGANAPTWLIGTQSDGSVSWAFTNVSYDTFVSDTDIVVFDEDVVSLGAQWRFLERNGLAFGGVKAAWDNWRMTAVSKLKGAKTIQMVPRRRGYLLSGASVPDTGYGVS